MRLPIKAAWFHPAFLLPLAALYLYGLSAMGIVTPDEPRYADIGRAMAQSGDWVMPRLFGVPWFEKPALLYWMTALGNCAGLGPELAPRLPVALLSLGFLAFFWHRVRREWGAETALYSTAMLATSAGWLAYSRTGVTDIPVAVCFNAALLFALPWATRPDAPKSGLTPAALCLAFGFLAKGIVPLALFFPVVVFGWQRAADWFRTLAIPAFLVIALPWYVAVSMQSEGEFLRVFFLEHTFGRVVSSNLQHVQKWWFYLWVLPLLCFPWFPLLLWLRPRDRRSRLLGSVVLFGLFAFSISINKLPGYVLPLVPSLAILMGESMARAERRIGLIFVAALAGLLPFTTAVLPAALAGGLRAANFPWVWLGAVPVAAFLGFLFTRANGRTAFFRIAAALTAGLFTLEVLVLPAIDQVASARPIWRREHPNCLKRMNRSLAYGLQYYAGRPLPDCPLLDPDNPRVVR